MIADERIIYQATNVKKLSALRGQAFRNQLPTEKGAKKGELSWHI